MPMKSARNFRSLAQYNLSLMHHMNSHISHNIVRSIFSLEFNGVGVVASPGPVGKVYVSVFELITWVVVHGNKITVRVSAPTHNIAGNCQALHNGLYFF